MLPIPLTNHLIAEPIPDTEHRSASGLVTLPTPQATRQATVLAVGPQVHDLRPGDTIVASSLVGTEVGPYWLLAEPSILAKRA